MRSPSYSTFVLGIGLAACAGTTSQPSSPEGDFAHYRSLPNYRAIAVTGGAQAGSSYASGWSSAATSIDDAVEVAMRECRAHRQPTQPPCELYAIGDLVVAGSDVATLARAECIYILEPAATSLASRYADACAALATAPPAAAAGTGARLNAREVRDEIIGDTLAIKGAAFIFLEPVGTADLRTADPVFGPDQGSWRLQPDGHLCLQWQRARAGREVCHQLRRSGVGYVLGDLPFTVIDGNPFRL